MKLLYLRACGWRITDEGVLGTLLGIGEFIQGWILILCKMLPSSLLLCRVPLQNWKLPSSRASIHSPGVQIIHSKQATLTCLRLSNGCTRSTTFIHSANFDVRDIHKSQSNDEDHPCHLQRTLSLLLLLYFSQATNTSRSVSCLSLLLESTLTLSSVRFVSNKETAQENRKQEKEMEKKPRVLAPFSHP